MMTFSKWLFQMSKSEREICIPQKVSNLFRPKSDVTCALRIKVYVEHGWT